MNPEDGVRKLWHRGGAHPEALWARSRARHSGASPMNPDSLGGAPQYRAAESAEPARRDPHRSFRLDSCPGDKVIQVENDYDRDVYNGDLGVISPSIWRKASSSPISTAPVESSIALASLMNLCSPTRRQSTRAKARNTRPVVDSHRHPALSDAAAELVYTGVTRGKRLVVLVGQRKALAIAVKGVGRRKRWSKLGEWLKAVVDQRGVSDQRIPCPDRERTESLTDIYVDGDASGA